MTDINERQRTPGQSAGIIRSAGIDGFGIPNIDQPIQPPRTPQLENVSGQFFQRADQAVSAAIQDQSNLISARAQNASAEAQALANSPNRSTLAEVIGGLSAGVELFSELQRNKRAQQAQVDTALFERRIRDQIVDMNSLIADNAHNHGFIPTQRQAFQEIDRQFAHLPIAARQEVYKIAQGALNEAQKQQTSRRINQIGELADTVREQRRQRLLTTVTARLERLRLSDNTDLINSTIDDILDDTDTFFESVGIDGIDAINLSTTVYELINANLEDNFKYTGTQQRRVNEFNQLAQEALRITQNVQDPRQRELLLAQLDARSGGQLPGINFRNLVPTNSEVTRQFLQEQESHAALRQYRQQNYWQGRDLNELDVFNLGAFIFGDFNGTPYNDFIRSQVANGEVTDPFYSNAVRLSDEFRQNVEDYRDLSNQYLQYEIDINQAQVDLEAIAKKLDPVGALGPVTVTGPLIERMVELAGRERGVISPAEAERLNELHQRRIGTFRERQVDTRRQLDNLIRRWQQYGLSLDNPNDNTLLTEFEARTKPLRQEAEDQFRRRLTNTPAGLGGPPNFSVGPMATTPPIVPLHTNTAGLTFPFQQSRNEQDIQTTSDYGPRRNPVTGRAQFHSGVDFDSVNGDENIRAVAGGEVLHVSDWSGYGGTVTVRTDSGHIEQYSHLRRFDVSVGDIIPPGTVVGLMGGGDGDPMAGRSTGRHLHFQVYAPGIAPERIGRPPYEQTTVDPIGYLSSLQHSTQLPLGAGLPPNQAHPSSDQVSFGNTWLDETYNNYRRTRQIGGSSVFSGDLTAATGPTSIYNRSNPQPSRRASISKAAYPSSNESIANYGYEALRDDPQFANAVSRVANSLDIPGQWLADVMAYESRLDPSIRNSAGAVGLIQFYPGGGLADIANRLGTSEGHAANLLTSMSAAEQMEFVEGYLRPFKGRLNTVEDLLAVVFGGEGLLNKPPSRRRSIGDGNITFGEYVTRLGNTVGRRYQTSYDRRRAAADSIHTSFSPGCARCNQMMSNFGFVLPHNE